MAMEIPENSVLLRRIDEFLKESAPQSLRRVLQERIDIQPVQETEQWQQIVHQRGLSGKIERFSWRAKHLSPGKKQDLHTFLLATGVALMSYLFDKSASKDSIGLLVR